MCLSIDPAIVFWPPKNVDIISVPQLFCYQVCRMQREGGKGFDARFMRHDFFLDSKGFLINYFFRVKKPTVVFFLLSDFFSIFSLKSCQTPGCTGGAQMLLFRAFDFPPRYPGELVKTSFVPSCPSLNYSTIVNSCRGQRTRKNCGLLEPARFEKSVWSWIGLRKENHISME